VAVQSTYNPWHLVNNHRNAVGRQGRRSRAAASLSSRLRILACRGRSRETRARALHPSAVFQRLTSAALLLIGLHCVARAQTFTEFPIPGESGTAAIVAGPDGNLWFSEYRKVGRVTPSGVITLFIPPSFSSFNNGIAAGPDGNLWFTENVGNIGRITPTGEITEFPLPVTFISPSPGAIAAGPDGNLWFTETAVLDTGVVGRIGRITTAGVITEFPVTAIMLSGSAVALSGIAAGPDGNLWFTKTGENKIGRITTGGVAADFPIPTPGSGPSFITAGPDGNLWFTEEAGQIGRITASGVVTEFPIPSVIASGFTMGQSGITVGPDGNIWFTEFLNSAVGRITPSGVMTEFPFPSFRAPHGIAAGPDGNLWLAVQGVPDLIARFTLPPLPPPPAASFYTLTPCRVIDTRNPTGAFGGPALVSQATRVFSMAGQCGIPSGATAVAVNMAVTQPTSGPGFLTLYPAGGPRPIASSINFSSGQTRANNAILPLGGSGGALSVFCGQGGGTTHLVLDVTGYFQ
jgi:streptogramin lyase